MNCVRIFPTVDGMWLSPRDGYYTVTRTYETRNRTQNKQLQQQNVTLADRAFDRVLVRLVEDELHGTG